MFSFTYLTTKHEFQTLEKELKIHCIPEGDLASVIIVAYYDNKFAGEVSVSIYSSKTITRKSNWEFVANQKRSAWIDRIDTRIQGQGLGRLLLDKAKTWVLERLHMCCKKNLYVASLHGAMNFYRRCGYHLIDTPDTSNGGLYILEYNHEVAEHMALPLFDKLDRENKSYDIATDKYRLHLIAQGEPDTLGIVDKLQQIEEDEFYCIFGNCLVFCDDILFKKLLKLSTPELIEQTMEEMLDCCMSGCYKNCIHSPSHDFAFTKNRTEIHKFVNEWTEKLKNLHSKNIK